MKKQAIKTTHCGASGPQGRCMRPAGHEGMHRTITVDGVRSGRDHEWSTQPCRATRPDSDAGQCVRPMDHDGAHRDEAAMVETHVHVMSKFLVHTLEPVDYSYDGLTPNERELCSREDFNAMVAWLVDER